jgi:glycerol-3-phosphate dehydrogenase
MDEPDAQTVIAASQGSHLVLPKAFLPGKSAVMVPNSPDGRVLFAVPWHDHVVVGTTDLGVDDITIEPVPMDEEIGFILTNVAKYLSKTPSRSDILSVYAGLRPLVKVGDAKSTAALSRDHTILISNAGLFDDRERQMDDLSQDGPRRCRASGNHGRPGGTPLQNRAFADPWLDQAGV